MKLPLKCTGTLSRGHHQIDDAAGNHVCVAGSDEARDFILSLGQAALTVAEIEKVTPNPHSFRSLSEAVEVAIHNSHQ